jgi:transcriptional regulator with XRE-family HTH domain
MGLRLRDLTEMCGIMKTTLSRYETGARIPKESNLRAIAHALGSDDILLRQWQPPRRELLGHNRVADDEIVRRYQLLRRIEHARMRPGDKRPEPRTIKEWRCSPWMHDAFERGLLPPRPDLGGELGLTSAPLTSAPTRSDS